MNIYDIAKLSGVSIATVSRVLNNKSGVSENARNKVLSVVEETDFVPNQLAISLANQKSNVIGLVMPGINDYFSNRIDAINKVCKEHGYSLMITSNYKDTNCIEDDLDNFNLLIEKRVDGIIYFPTHVSIPHKAFLKKIENRIPIVVTDSHIDDINMTSVIQDAMTAASEMMRYLIDGNHRNIGYINGLSYDKVNNWRFIAYKTQLEKAGIKYRDELVVEGNFSFESGYTCMKKLLKQVKLTAVFAANDKMAMGAIKAVVDAGLKVPEDISIVGYDGIEYGQFYNPSLTTIRVNQNELGRRAAEALIKQIENKGTPVRKIVMDYDFVLGDSSRENREIIL